MSDLIEPTEDPLEEIAEMLRILVILQMRNHDALMVMISQNSKLVAETLSNKHNQGQWVSDFPWIKND